jgi:hypothetical protein
MGRAFRVLKRTAHLTIAVSERPEKIVAVAPEGAPKRARGARPSASAGRPAKGSTRQTKPAGKAKKAKE